MIQTSPYANYVNAQPACPRHLSLTVAAQPTTNARHPTFYRLGRLEDTSYHLDIFVRSNNMRIYEACIRELSGYPLGIPLDTDAKW